MEQKKDFVERLRSSAKEITQTRVLTLCALFGALSVVLRMVASIDIGPYIRIGFSDIPNELTDALFGPITGMIFAFVMDIVNYMIKPTGAFFFGFTFNAMLAAVIYGCFYYKRKITLPRILAAKAVVSLVVNVLLNTLWLSMLYGKAFTVILPARALKNLIMWPINSIILFIVFTAIEKSGILAKFRKGIAF